MNRIIKISFLSALCILVFAANAFSLDKYYLLRKGNLAAAEGKTEDSVQYLTQYIESHPTTIGTQSKQYVKKRQYYMRNLLIAYSNLLDILREEGDLRRIDILMKKLKNTFISADFGSKNLYTLGSIFCENNHADEAVVIFEKIISEQKTNYHPYNIKAALRAGSKLLELYQSRHENKKISLLLEKLKSIYPNSDFDPIDKYTLATLFLENGLEPHGEDLLRKIVVEEDLDSGGSNSAVLIKTYCKLLTICHKRKDAAQLERLMGQISRDIRIGDLSPGNTYNLAVSYLKCKETTQGLKLLMTISDRYSQTHFGRKALFLLGRESQALGDWDSAIKYFAEYIEKYPSPPFFALKVYSRLIDSYWARDADTKFVEDEAKKLADIVNGISDFETQLNLARDLMWKGFDELASATFTLGLASAKGFISENEGTYAALRTHWLIERYAVELDMPDIAEASAKRILETAEDQKNDPSNAEKIENIEYIRSQTYLWLAEICKNRLDFAGSEKFLNIFIKAYPAHRDIAYARYKLGKVYEATERIDEAMKEYRMVEGDNMWKEKATRAAKGCVD